jgi:glycosyltransferase involved in cell wall biosynthesis
VGVRGISPSVTSLRSRTVETMADNILESIIITAFDRSAYYVQAVNSVLPIARGRTDIEIVLLKNFEDKTMDAAFKAKGVRLYSGSSPLSGRTLRRAIEVSRGSYLAFLDDDDLFKPTKIARFEHVLQRVPNLGYYHHQFDLSLQDKAGIGAWDRFSLSHHNSRRAGTDFRTFKDPTAPGLFPFLAYRNREQNLSSTVIHREVAGRIVPILDSLPVMTDTIILTAGLISEQALVFDESAQSTVRRHGNNFSNSRKNLDARLEVFERLEQFCANSNARQMVLDYLRLRAAREVIYQGLIGKAHSQAETRRAVRTLGHFYRRLTGPRDLGYLTLGSLEAVFPRLLPLLHPLAVGSTDSDSNPTLDIRFDDNASRSGIEPGQIAARTDANPPNTIRSDFRGYRTENARFSDSGPVGVGRVGSESTVGERKIGDREGCLLSVVVTAHDRREYIGEAIASVFRQAPTERDVDLVVLANFDPSYYGGSGGVTAPRWIPDPSPNVGETIVRAAECARGEVLVFLDDDDLFDPRKLARVEATFLANPKLAYYHNDFSQFYRSRGPSDPASRRDEEDRSRHLHLGRQITFQADDSDRMLPFLARANREQNMSSVAVKKDLIIRNRDFIKKIQGLQDTLLLFCAISGAGSVIFDDSRLTWVRRHAGNVSKTVVDAERRVRAWQVVSDLIQSNGPLGLAASYFAIRHSRATIFERAMGAQVSTQSIAEALRTVLNSAAVSGSRNTAIYSLLALMDLGPQSATAFLKPMLAR